MNIWGVLISMVAGAAISELYHMRMWNRYQQGKREGRAYHEDTKQRITIRK